MTSNKGKISSYIQEKGQATVAELDEVLDIGRAMIHRHLKTLLEEGVVDKVGKPPKVFYIPKGTGAAVQTVSSSITPNDFAVIEKNFLLITPQGERVEGVSGFSQWCADRRYAIEKKATEYVGSYEKYSALKKGGLLDGTRKMLDTFKGGCRLDKAYYIDFYAWEVFGKTKLGQLLLYAKQSQDKKMIREIAAFTAPAVAKLISKHHCEAVGYIPPTVKRTVQLMDVLKKNIPVIVPEIVLEKVAGEVRVPQKTLSKLEDRIANAQATIFVADRRKFRTVLLVDDAVGSGATFNEVARKLKEQGVAEKVIGLAVTGSLKGFDVISEV